MSPKKKMCAGCGKELTAGDRAAQVRMGELNQNLNLTHAQSKMWASMHRECFLRSINSPTAARTLLEESGRG